MPETLRPGSLAETAEAIAAAGADGASIAIVGGGSKGAVGAPEQPHWWLDLSGMSALESYEPGELVLRAGAGARVADIEALLAEHGQMLAFEPPDLGSLLGGEGARSTLGGMIAAGFSGPRRVSAGAVRDHLLGFEAATGAGAAFKAGGPVVKNVTGYDLPKLICGSWGTLAALTSVTLKVLPKPRAILTLAIHGLSPPAAVKAMSIAMGGPWAVSGAAHAPSDDWTLLRLEGFEPSVQARAAALLEAMQAFGPVQLLDEDLSVGVWRRVREVAGLAGAGDRVWRISCPPAAGGKLAAALGGRFLMDWAGGLIWLAAPADCDIAADAKRIRAACTAHGAHAMLLRASAEDRAKVAAISLADPGLERLSLRVKSAFDPWNVLSPRRFAGAFSTVF
jgi:glycolate oxidase FAD binding subunit